MPYSSDTFPSLYSFAYHGVDIYFVLFYFAFIVGADVSICPSPFYMQILYQK